MPSETKGFVPGGEDRVQWYFEGNDWTPEEQQLLIDLVTEHVKAIREQFGFDVTNYFRFTKDRFGFEMDGSTIEYLYFCQRRNWQYNLMSTSFEGLVQQVRDGLDT